MRVVALYFEMLIVGMHLSNTRLHARLLCKALHQQEATGSGGAVGRAAWGAQLLGMGFEMALRAAARPGWEGTEPMGLRGADLLCRNSTVMQGELMAVLCACQRCSES